MNKITRVLSFTLLAIGLAFSCSAQTVLTPTTLSAAISTTAATGTPFINITVASATNFVANTTMIIVDSEAMDVKAVSGTTITVLPAQHGTRRSLHNSGAFVWVGTFAQLGFSDTKQGSCTRANEITLPHISILGTPATVNVYDCHAGQWINGGVTAVPTATQPFSVVQPAIGATLYTGINTNGTALTATTLYCSGITLPNMLISTMGALAGTTVGTDKWYYTLYDASGGTALAYSATAGVTTSGASIFQNQALVTPYYAVAGSYFGCLSTNGTADVARLSVTGQVDGILTKGQTSATFGTLQSLTSPTTYTTATGPIWIVK